ncbi:MAG: metal-dependent hydrolase [Caldisericia bacterium]|nr:metal-dependent hydrolase [Caldisericia bacterium]
MRNILTYFGHSCFSIKWEEGEIIIDPFLDFEKAKEYLKNIKITHIFITHGHQDHIGETVKLYEIFKPKVAGIYELTLYLNKKGVKEEDLIPINFSGFLSFPFGKVKMVNALHSSSFLENENIVYLGNPCGYIFKMGERTIYHMGDTGLSYEFKMIGELEKIDISLTPIGGNYTMDIDDAITAVKFLKPQYVIPMHFDTFPEIKVDLNIFKNRVEFETNSKCIILKPFESF